MWPRTFAQQIVKLPDRTQRNAALREVPQHLQAIVKRHCLNTWNHPSRRPAREPKTA